MISSVLGAGLKGAVTSLLMAAYIKSGKLMKKSNLNVWLHLICLLTAIVFMFATRADADIPEAVLARQKAVVMIFVKSAYDSSVTTGSGFIIDSGGIVVTNYHVIKSVGDEGRGRILFKLQNGEMLNLESIVAVDTYNDIAVVKIAGRGLPTIRIAPNYKPRQGESIVVIGSPMGLETTVSDGIISGIRGRGEYLQITAPISPGSSGSPVMNYSGEAIGIATMMLEGGQNLNFAIPVKFVAKLLGTYRLQGDSGVTSGSQTPSQQRRTGETSDVYVNNTDGQPKERSLRGDEGKSFFSEWGTLGVVLAVILGINVVLVAVILILRSGRKEYSKGRVEIILTSDGKTASYRFDDKIVISREMLSDADQSMSNPHAVIRLTSQGYTIEDMGSKNGTFLNKKRINSSSLKDGDAILAGKSVFIFRAK